MYLFAYAFTIDCLHLSHSRLHNTSVVWVYSYSGSRNTWQLENDEFNKAIFYGIGWHGSCFIYIFGRVSKQIDRGLPEFGAHSHMPDLKTSCSSKCAETECRRSTSATLFGRTNGVMNFHACLFHCPIRRPVSFQFAATAQVDGNKRDAVSFQLRGLLNSLFGAPDGPAASQPNIDGESESQLAVKKWLRLYL